MASALSKIEPAKAELCGLVLAPRLVKMGQEGWESLDQATLRMS
jgi:ferredoxin-nitrite reductase